jgi:hypothetical protein
MPGVASRVLRSTVGPLAIYALASVAFFGRPLLRHGDRDYVGSHEYDPQIFIWSFGWWLHAILDGENPIVSHAMWPVTGVNLAWVAGAPGLAFLVAPVTLLAGPALAFNVAAVALPALAAWTAFLLCRYLTGNWWASLAGGYLFGFSSYVLGHTTSHLHMTSVFLVPLVALTVLQYVHARIGGRALALRLGVLLGAQVYLSTEVFATLTVSLVASLVAAFVAVPDARARLRSAVGPLLGAYVVACVVAGPILWYALTDFRTGSINDPALFPADLLNLVVPTELTYVSGDRASAWSREFLGNSAENGAYLGLPLLVVLGWFAWQRRRQPAGRLLVVLLALGIVAELGVALRVAGDRVVALPWAIAAELPGLNNVLPVRFSMYVSLAAAVAAALWAASPRPSAWLRVALVAAAVVSLLPAASRDFWSRTPARPSFFADDTYRTCFRPDENVFIPDAAGMDAALWQAESGFRFRLANGALSPELPEGIPDPEAALEVLYDVVPDGGGAAVVRLARGLDATVIMLDAEHLEQWGPVLEEAGLEPVANGGIWLYHLGPVPPSCRVSGP